MRNLHQWSFRLGALVACTISQLIYAQPSNGQDSSTTSLAQNYSTSSNFAGNPNPSASSSLRVGVVNTKRCLEESKLGKQEQVNFEKMKRQMESVLQEKEKALEEIESKLNDDDYMDSITDEAASELKRKRRTIRTEGMQLQNQYMQTLQQANVKVIQRLTEVISQASAQVAQDTSSGEPVDVIFTDEACTYYARRLDVSERIIQKMNAIFDAEQRDNAAKQR